MLCTASSSRCIPDAPCYGVAIGLKKWLQGCRLVGRRLTYYAQSPGLSIHYQMKLGVAIHTCNPSTLKIEVGGSKVPPLFHTEFNTNLSCIRFYLKRKKERVLNLAPAPLPCRLGTVSAALALTNFSCQLDSPESSENGLSTEGVQTTNGIDPCACRWETVLTGD